MTSFFAITIIVNTLLVAHPTPQGVEVYTLCQVTIDGKDAGTARSSDCEELGQNMKAGWEKGHPGQPARLVVDGFDYTKA